MAFEELTQTRNDLEKLKEEFLTTQKKYQAYLSEYEQKLEEVYGQSERIQREQDEKERNLLKATSEWLAIKSNLEKSVMLPKQKVVLNIGGSYFETTVETLTGNNQTSISFFQSLFSQQWQLERDPKDESIFIDRDGTLFEYILKYLRTGQVSAGTDDPLLRRDLLAEAEFYKIDSLIAVLKTQSEETIFYLNSKILSSNNQIKLNKLFTKIDQQWRLIYRASRDGYTAKLFHQFCDKKGPTMTVIRSHNRFIFGGFTAIPWDSFGYEKADPSAFLFTLTNPFGIPPTKYPVREQASGFAVSHGPENGPTFGSIHNGGSDIFLRSPFNHSGSRIFLPQTYKDTTGKGRITFTGDSHFYCDDLEVFTFV